MRILILTQWYSPEPVGLLPEFAESLQAAGHEITVLTGYPNYPYGKLYPGYRLRLVQRQEINGVPVIRVPLYPYHGRSPIRRAANLLSFALSAAFLGPWLVPRVDVIYIRHFHLAGGPAWLLSRLFRVPFVYAIQDIWPETLFATGMLTNRWILRMLGWYAKRVYRNAAAIRVISPGFRTNLLGKGVPDDKVHVVPNWVDTALYRPLAADAGLAKKLGLEGRFNVMYGGNLGVSQGLDTVLEAASLLQDLPDVQFVFVGDGADRERLQQISRERKLCNVKFLGRYPGEQMSRLNALADVLLIHLRDEPLFRITIPHKVFAYMASGTPVLAAVAGDVADLISSAQAGLTCPSCDCQAMAHTVRKFYSMSPAQRQTLAQNGRRTACEKFNQDQLIGELTKILEGVVSRHKATGALR